jgi:hypothetical protein
MILSRTVDTQQFWALIEDARCQVPGAMDGEMIAARATVLLQAFPCEEIVAAGQILWDLMAESYRRPLGAAAYMINGGCSDDGFDDFRGWLIMQGRAVFERIVADPDALADLPAIRAEAPRGAHLGCENTLYIAFRAHLAATGTEYPGGVLTIQYPELDPGWDFDFGGRTEIKRRLPRLAALCLG